ncbi:LysR family transcriptional regulator [Nesterenkonia sp.]|uniref:LysR family transcriptional regulator n=1 Tax=Nesterenkonia sp. TaxID=704201 RepID=UPI00261C327C|nr:LysR family transcriptional regulator [Nesterenkonia sp.]
MDTRLLRYFAAVVEAGTVSSAADQLHLTQPSLSRQIRQLERQVGLRLFARQRGRLVLTSEGRAFYEAARALLEHHHETAEYAAQLAGGRMTTVRLAAPATTLTDVVAPFVATFLPEDPVPAVSEMEIDAELGPALAEFDMLVAPVRWPAGAHSLHLVNLPVWAYVPRRHRWAGREAVSLEELAEETLILPTMQFKARRVLEAALAQAQTAGKTLGPAATVETRHSQVAQALAAAGRGAAVLTDDPRYDLHGLRILSAGQPLEIQLWAGWRAGHHAAATLEAMAQRLREFCRTRYPQ